MPILKRPRTTEVLQEPPAEQRLGVMYLFPHANGGHPALESQQTLNHFAELGILDTMRSCNQNSTRLIHQELCKLRRDENLSTIFVPAHLMQHLAEDGCFRSSWQDRYIKHLDRSNIDWRKVDTDFNAELVKGGQAKALYGYQRLSWSKNDSNAFVLSGSPSFNSPVQFP